MPIFADGPVTDPEFVEHDDVLEWLAHPEERGQRASHAIRGEDGVWIVDPVDAPGLDDRLAELGDVAGAVVCTHTHSRDASAIASRHGVSVHCPAGLDRAAERVDAPIAWIEDEPFDPAFELRTATPAPGWQETVLQFGDAVYVPESFGTAPTHALDDERLGVYLFARLLLPEQLFTDLEPDRLFFGHGRALTADAAAALDDAMDGHRRRFPKAMVVHGPEQIGAIVRNVVLE